tara:strand:- start:856 stop:1035 length:180 start_codon:yes stop_codon:yes gene_type:complete
MDITGMLAVGNGEPCPFCIKEQRTENIFISQPENNILTHMMDEHKAAMEEALWGGQDDK